MESTSLKDKHILLGITGSIAAYKSAFLVRELQKAGAIVKVVMSPSATEFIPAITLSTLSHNKVYTELIDAGEWNSHVELGLWADIMLIAPLTANTLAKMAAGICDSMLLACWLSAKCPIAIAPAMDRDMYKHPATKQNLDTLKSWNHHIIPARHGELASGLIGQGRMAEPADIVHFLKKDFFSGADISSQLTQKNILVTAGPTHENIDPVRFIGNRSTGKMGCAIADACARRGADVTLLLGPTHIRPVVHGINIIHTESAQEMYTHAVELFPQMDAAFMAAAVADYKVENPSDEKIKKVGDKLILELVRNPDIAYTLGKHKSESQFICGFAMETQNGIENARAKLQKKNFDMIALNMLHEEGAGFAHNTNKVTVVTKTDETIQFPLMSKAELAGHLVDHYIKLQNL